MHAVASKKWTKEKPALLIHARRMKEYDYYEKGYVIHEYRAICSQEMKESRKYK